MLEHRSSDLDLVVATHVCQYWRSTLTSSPSLWTRFQFTSSHVDRALAYLERSKSAPIDANLNFLQDREVFKHLAPHIARTRSLSIRGPYHNDIQAACFLLRTPSPTLQYLKVDTSGGLAHLPDDFLGRQAPSLRSITFNNIRPALESPLPLPSLIKFELFLSEGTGPFRMGALFRFLSECPQLRKICINSREMAQDDTPDQVILLESLVKLDYTCSTVDRILPCLKLPRLERLRVSSSFGPGQKLVDLLPHGGHTLLAGATEIKYHSSKLSQWIQLFGKGTDVSFTMVHPTADHTPAAWFPNDRSIPFGQIENLTVGISVAVDFPINVAVFENLRVLRTFPWSTRFAERLFRSLYDPGVVVPCRFLREIQYPSWGPPGPLMSLVKERKRAGHGLGLVCLLANRKYGPDRDFVEELKEHAREVRVEEWDGMM